MEDSTKKEFLVICDRSPHVARKGLASSKVTTSKCNPAEHLLSSIFNSSRAELLVTYKNHGLATWNSDLRFTKMYESPFVYETLQNTLNGDDAFELWMKTALTSKASRGNLNYYYNDLVKLVTNGFSDEGKAKYEPLYTKLIPELNLTPHGLVEQVYKFLIRRSNDGRYGLQIGDGLREISLYQKINEITSGIETLFPGYKVNEYFYHKLFEAILGLETVKISADESDMQVQVISEEIGYILEFYSEFCINLCDEVKSRLAARGKFNIALEYNLKNMFRNHRRIKPADMQSVVDYCIGFEEYIDFNTDRIQEIKNRFYKNNPETAKSILMNFKKMSEISV